jgi:hypothetical protein
MVFLAVVFLGVVFLAVDFLGATFLPALLRAPVFLGALTDDFLAAPRDVFLAGLMGRGR